MTNERTKKDIIALARHYKKELNTHDPFIIAGYLGIDIGYSIPMKKETMQAYILKAHSHVNPKIIINPNFDNRSRLVLCAHELGHAVLHTHHSCNHFDGDPLRDATEEQANLFAVALLFNEEDLNLKFESMNNYLLRALLEYNIKY